MANIPVKLGRRRVIRVILEAEQGTAIDPGTAELLAYDAMIQPDDNMIVREPGSGSGGRFTSERGPGTCTCTFRVELRGDGADALDAGIEVCLQGCAMTLAGAVYSPESVIATQKTISISIWRGGHYERCYGAMGDWELTGEFGKQVFLEFTFQGLYAIEADEALPVTAHSTEVPFRFAGATTTLGGLSPKISRVAISPNNPVEMRECGDAAEGVIHAMIGPNRNYTIGMDPEDPAAATFDFRSLWLAKTTAAFSMLLTDGTVNVTITAPKVQQMPPQEAQRDSKATFEMVGQCNTNTGDDELIITTAAVV